MSVAFWSEVVTAKKPFETQPPEGYVMNLQNVAVCNVKDTVSLFACTDSISGDKIKALLAVLSSKNPQAQLSLVFGYDVPVSFRVEGCNKAEVHISGYYQPTGESDDESDDEGDDFDEEAYLNTLKNADGSLNEEGKMLIQDDMSGSEDSEESDSEDERVDAEFIKNMIAKNGDGATKESDSSEEDSDEDSEEDSEEDTESEEEPPKKKIVSTPSSGNKSKQNTPVSKGKSVQNSNQKKNQKSGEKRKR